MRKETHSLQLSLFQRAKDIRETRITVAAYAGETVALRILGIATAITLVLYLYFVGLSIVNMIAHREADTQATALQSRVAALEERYFELSREISPAMAPQLGLTKAVDKQYIRRESGVALLRETGL